MRFAATLAVALSAVQSVVGLPQPVAETTDVADSVLTSKTCKNPTIRKEWRRLTKTERTAYLNAVQCMKTKKSKVAHLYPGTKSRYDDYQLMHILNTDHIHWIGYFLPWHRVMLQMWEDDLKQLCCYQGGVPYWDFTLDVNSLADLNNSPVFDATYGFGGNGEYLADLSGIPANQLFALTIPTANRTGGGCVKNGPFKSWKVSMGPGNSVAYNPHCLYRDFIPSILKLSGGAANWAWQQEAPDYFQYMRRVEGLALGIPNMKSHAAGHIGVGGMTGEMSNTYSSPGDPLFYLHHAQLDKGWDQWQRKNFAVRKLDMAGPDTMYAYPYNHFGDVPYQNITVDFVMTFGANFGGDFKIRDYMDTQGGKLCYKYE